MQFLLETLTPVNFINAFFNNLKRIAELLTTKKQITGWDGGGKFEVNAAAFLNKKVVKNDNFDITGTQIENDKHVALLKKYAYGLEEMIFITHHKVRQPVANILTLADMIDEDTVASEELKKVVQYIKQSATDLDTFTRELTALMSKLEESKL